MVLDGHDGWKSTTFHIVILCRTAVAICVDANFWLFSRSGKKDDLLQALRNKLHEKNGAISKEPISFVLLDASKQQIELTNQASFKEIQLMMDDFGLTHDYFCCFYIEDWSNPTELHPRKTNGWSPKIETVWVHVSPFPVGVGVSSGSSRLFSGVYLKFIFCEYWLCPDQRSNIYSLEV